MQGKHGLNKIVMEMIYPDQQIYIDRLYSEYFDYPYEPSYIPYLIKWKEDIWPWRWYKNIVEISLSEGISLIHGNISEKEASLIRNIYSSLENDYIDQDLKVLSKLIDKSHRNFPKWNQNHSRAKIHLEVDRRIVKNILQDLNGYVIVIAGRTHVRNDIGVGKHLKGNSSVVSIGLISSTQIKTEFENQPFDYVIVTFNSKLDFLYFTVMQKLTHISIIAAPLTAQ